MKREAGVATSGEREEGRARQGWGQRDTDYLENGHGLEQTLEETVRDREA